jgi:hypothetical protein
MKVILFISLVFFSSFSIAESNRLDRKSNDYKYTSIGLHFVESDKSGFAINLSLDLPGPFYTTLERKADGVDYKKESYDKVTDTARLGFNMGIGDLIGNISSGDVNLKIKNLFDVYAEVGIKTSDFDGERFNFEGNDSYASFLAGIRFGNSNTWEGKIFLDASKEAIIKDSGNPVCKALFCPPYDAELSDDTDKKFGIGVTYNINNRSALFLEASSSKVTENLFKLGYQLYW